MDAYEEVASLVRSEDEAHRIAEYDENRAKELLSAALDLLRDAQDVIALNPEGLTPPVI